MVTMTGAELMRRIDRVLVTGSSDLLQDAADDADIAEWLWWVQPGAIATTTERAELDTMLMIKPPQTLGPSWTCLLKANELRDILGNRAETPAGLLRVSVSEAVR